MKGKLIDDYFLILFIKRELIYTFKQRVSNWKPFLSAQYFTRNKINFALIFVFLNKYFYKWKCIKNSTNKIDK